MNTEEKLSNERAVDFCTITNRDGTIRPNKKEQDEITRILTPIKKAAENEITRILKKIEKEHSIYIWVDYKNEAKLTFISTAQNFIEV